MDMIPDFERRLASEQARTGTPDRAASSLLVFAAVCVGLLALALLLPVRSVLPDLAALPIGP